MKKYCRIVSDRIDMLGLLSRSGFRVDDIHITLESHYSPNRNLRNARTPITVLVIFNVKVGVKKYKL